MQTERILPSSPGARSPLQPSPADNDDTATTATAPNPSDSPSITPTIVCQLRGEMGNQLGHLAHCHALKWHFERIYGLETRIVVRNPPTGGTVADSFIDCFPKLRRLDFERGFTREFEEKQKQQQDKWGLEISRMLDIGAHTRYPRDLPKLDQAVKLFVNLTLIHTASAPAASTAAQSTTDLQLDRQTQNHTTLLPISLPFLYVNAMVSRDIIMDEYFDDVWELFEFDYDRCCKLRPDPDESVFVSHTGAYWLEREQFAKLVTHTSTHQC